MQLAIQSLGIPTGVAGWDLLQNETATNFPALTNDPVLKQQIAYFEKNAPKATTAQALLSDPQLQDFVLTAYGLTSESGMTALMEKVLNSAPNSTTSFAARMVNSQFTQIAAAFNYGGTPTPAVPATSSVANVAFSGLYQQSTFGTFSGTFGGVTVSNVDLTGATTWQGLANTLQAAFQRADGNRTDIKVTLSGSSLTFSDGKGRGSATSFAWTSNAANTGSAPTAASPVIVSAGAAAQPETGGPSITNPSFIQQVVQLYTNAQFQQVVGNTSDTLREALYAKQQLPSITSWNQIIANRPLADVIQTVLGLPQAFGALNITQQAQVFSSRMNIADFQNPTKVAKLLNQFVAMGSSQSSTVPTSPAIQLLNSNASSNGIINLTLPTLGSTSGSTTTDSYSSGSMAAMLLSSMSGG
jgi:hypothetical protein